MQNKKLTKKTQLGVTEAPKRRGRPPKSVVIRIKTAEEFKKDGLDVEKPNDIFTFNWDRDMNYLLGQIITLPPGFKWRSGFKLRDVAPHLVSTNNWWIQNNHFIKEGKPGFKLAPAKQTKSKAIKAVKVIKTVKTVKAVKQPSKVATVMTFMEKAKNASKPNPAVKELSDKMLFVSANSLKNLKWLKEGERLELLPGGQRTIVGRHVEVIRQSIQTYGMLRPIIIVEVDFFDGVSRKYVADGQHALMACLRLGIAIPYIVVNGIKDKQELTSLVTYLNSSSKSWKQGDYVNAWAESIEDYKELIKLKQKFDLDYDVVISASTGRDGGQNIKDLKKGLFRMENPTKAHLTCSRVANLLTLVPKMDRWSTRALVRAAVAVFSEQDYTPSKHKKLMEYVKENSDQLRFCTSAKEIALAFLRRGL